MNTEYLANELKQRYGLLNSIDLIDTAGILAAIDAVVAYKCQSAVEGANRRIKELEDVETHLSQLVTRLQLRHGLEREHAERKRKSKR